MVVQALRGASLSPSLTSSLAALCAQRLARGEVGALKLSCEASIVDAKGSRVPTAAALLNFTLTGPGFIAGVGNGDPSSHEHDKPTGSLSRAQRSAWNGLSRVIVQAVRGATTPAAITLHAAGKALRDAEVKIAVA